MNASSPTGLPDFDALWDFDHPGETEARFRDLLPAAQASGDRDYHLQLLTQIARTQGLQRRYGAAHATLEYVREWITDDLKTVRVRYLLERGRCFNDQGNYEQAKASFVEAWDVAREHRLDGYAVDAAHMMGIIERPAEVALEWNQRAMEYAKGSEDPTARRWLASLQNNIGWTLLGMGRHGEALTVFEEALELRRQNGRPGPIRIARYGVGKAKRVLGRVDEALEEQTSLLGECERAGEPDGYVHEEVAECLTALGRATEARAHFARAYALLSKDPWFPAEEKGRLGRMRELGGLA